MEKFINRELSLLQFHRRVLQQASSAMHPLLERLNFLRIFSSNLDEFFEIRVAGLIRQQRLGLTTVGIDGLSPQQVLQHIAHFCHEAVIDQYRVFNEQ